MTGKKINFEELFESQRRNQLNLLKSGLYQGFSSDEEIELPKDDVRLYSYHMLQLMSEVGEILSADKRWKNIRKDSNDKDNKKEEIADCFIVLMNVAMFSGIGSEEMLEAIEEKISKVKERIERETI